MEKDNDNPLSFVTKFFTDSTVRWDAERWYAVLKCSFQSCAHTRGPCAAIAAAFRFSQRAWPSLPHGPLLCFSRQFSSPLFLLLLFLSLAWPSLRLCNSWNTKLSTRFCASLPVKLNAHAILRHVPNESFIVLCITVRCSWDSPLGAFACSERNIANSTKIENAKWPPCCNKRRKCKLASRCLSPLSRRGNSVTTPLICNSSPFAAVCVGFRKQLFADYLCRLVCLGAYFLPWHRIISECEAWTSSVPLRLLALRLRSCCAETCGC